jgi:uncharacterized protein (DUF1015 family)
VFLFIQFDDGAFVVLNGALHGNRYESSMPLIRPFRGLRPAVESAQQIIAPPYDVLTTKEARGLAANAPDNFLHVSKPEIDLPENISAYDPRVYSKGAENFQRLIRDGLLGQDTLPCFYLYRLQRADHVQSGIVVTVSVADYEGDHIRRHELTRPDKEDDRVHHMEALNAQTGPVLLVYPDDPYAQQLIATHSEVTPVYESLTLNDVEHTLWVIDDPDTMTAASRAFASMPAFYIADGHHRSAAAARVAARRDHKDEAANHFLAVLFPVSEMQIFDYNRLIKDLNGLLPQVFVDQVARRFSVSEEDRPVRPAAAGEFGMYIAGRWYRLRAAGEWLQEDDPFMRLDVTILNARLLQPLLGIEDLRRDPRIECVGGVRGLAELQRRVDSGEMAVAVSIHPTPLPALIAVADAGEIMPPKSTWFEPKLADGLVSHMLGT